MPIRKKMWGLVMCVVGVLFATQTALADHEANSGSFKAILSAVTDFAAVEIMGTVVRVGTLDGTVTITESSGGPFELNSSSTLASAVYVKKSATGIDLEASGVITDSAGDQWYNIARRSAGDQSVGGGGTGRQEIPGGTGKYGGIIGSCEYYVDYLPDNKLVTYSTCQWKRN